MLRPRSCSRFQPGWQTSARNQATRASSGVPSSLVNTRRYRCRGSHSISTLPTSKTTASTMAASTSATIPAFRIDRQNQGRVRSEAHTSELQSLMRISYAVFCLKQKKTTIQHYQLQQRHTTTPEHTISVSDNT